VLLAFLAHAHRREKAELADSLLAFGAAVAEYFPTVPAPTDVASSARYLMLHVASRIFRSVCSVADQ
jgi:hypothetical protein